MALVDFWYLKALLDEFKYMHHLTMPSSQNIWLWFLGKMAEFYITGNAMVGGSHVFHVKIIRFHIIFYHIENVAMLWNMETDYVDMEHMRTPYWCCKSHLITFVHSWSFEPKGHSYPKTAIYFKCFCLPDIFVHWRKTLYCDL